MQSIVECVPNFSNGRDPEVYGRIVDAIRSVTAVQVLDVSADRDHNRTVVTFVGAPKDVVEAGFRGIAAAKDLINLDEHQGEHPRIGATDVFPFIPVRGVTLDECVSLAQQLGKRVGEELGVAVYLYAAAATRPERESLAAIRKGQYEQWKEEVATNPDRRPDFGPAEPQKWGATVIGARPFLIAYNLYLNSDNVAVAEAIARAIRHSSGGLRYVQARGFLVDGQAQVSMNLTHFERTPIYRVQETVRREAAQHGLMVTRAELVGLIPQKALLDSAKWYLQLNDLEDEQILELRLQSSLPAPSAGSGIPQAAGFADAVAAATPTPGGGSVAALVGALGAALTHMAAGLTVGRKRYIDVSEQAGQIQEQAEAIRRELTTAIEEDAASFEAILAVVRNKELGNDAKEAAMEAATVHAGEVPLQVARLSRDAARLAQTIAAIGNVNAATDAAVGAIMARAAVHGAGLNVKVNGAGLKNREQAAAWSSEVDALVGETEELARQAVEIAKERGGL
ncbi:MAG: glutamate formimidoyltransferase [Anaerolineales bacterium]|uniref:glutamate formimidoyltransferase n=1 Tax=Promineifilum sp. TaxID=2664178 RepID=UPI001DE216E5|nr:glutamate formimidoyltransferase [Anaerolineales bacterium]MCB8935139.1 glutamate formimidoyltransferase [Promineifilum sp.]MCO5179130.1 glutamate formimidoyltransferase [Promineifilum sp.]